MAKARLGLLGRGLERQGRAGYGAANVVGCRFARAGLLVRLGMAC